ncbi:ATP-binding protein [candidate division CSSED10-310 bacterium]|uniref:histidine kinase n=1 Tax=candidate division CSSED10-310 bacterium TaxID=2855610 RepID=A0ABV6YRR9_UNCC1
MNFRPKPLIPFIITLYISLLILGWGALKIIDQLNIERAEHLLKTEAANISFFLASEHENLIRFEKIVEKWWLEQGKLPEFSADFPFKVKLIAGHVAENQINHHNVIDWNIKNFNQRKYFCLSLKSRLINKTTKDSCLIEVSRIIIPARLKSKVNLALLVFKPSGVLQASALGNNIEILAKKSAISRKIFDISDEILSNLRLGKGHSPLKINFMGSQLIYYVPFTVQGEVKAIFGLLYPLQRMDEARTSLTLLTVAILSLVTIILTAVYYFTTRQLNLYLQQLFDFTKQLASGDFSGRLAPGTGGELSQINVSLNHMAAALEKMKKYEQEMIVFDRLDSLAQLSTGIAHEIKNPLMVLKYSANHLKKTMSEPALKEDVDMMEKNVLRIEKVVQRLAEFSQPADLEEKTTQDLIPILNETIFFLQKTCDNNKIRVNFSPGIKTAHAKIRRNAISQVFTNVILNAIEAMPQGGEINISLELLTDEKSRAMALFYFRDTGHGIDRETRVKVFNPFFTTKHTGTGLGLAITYQIMIEHGGFIDLISPAPRSESEIQKEAPQHLKPKGEFQTGTLVKLGFPVQEQDELS